MKTPAPFCRCSPVLCRASLASILGTLVGLFVSLSDAAGQTSHPGNPLRIPPVWSGGTLTAAPTNQTLWPGFSTSLLAINDSVPSPTIRVQRGSNFTARIDNRLDTNLVLHWHGIIAPPAMDGHPRDAVPPGSNYTVNFPIRQRAGTYFYHPHTEPLTGELVYRGLAGAFIIEDAAEASLGLPTGDHDLPLLVQDKRLRPDRQLVYDASSNDVMTGFLGDTVLVNGTPEAYLSVDKSLYRFRLVNGSNARVYKLAFSDARPFHLIATDGGLLPAPVTVSSAFLAPGERVEILVDVALVAPLLNDNEPRVASSAATALRRWIETKASPPSTEAESHLGDLQRWKKWWRAEAGRFPRTTDLSHSEVTPRLLKTADFLLEDWRGQPVRLSDFKERVVLLHFFDTAITNSVSDLPDLIALQAHHKDSLAVFGIASDTAALAQTCKHIPGEKCPACERAAAGKPPVDVPQVCARLAELVSQRQVQHPLAIDPTGEVMKRFVAYRLPVFVLVDRAGHVWRRFAGNRSRSAWEAIVAEAIQGTEPHINALAAHRAKPQPKGIEALAPEGVTSR